MGTDEDREQEEKARPMPWLALVPSVLLVLVALNQIHLAHSASLDPWKGGGFGMFASTRGSESRHSHLFALREGADEIEVDLPEDLEDEEERLLTLPTPGRFDDFSKKLSESMQGELPDLAGIRVELWLSRFDVTDLTPDTRLMLEHEYRLDGHEAR
jgi:hypothetical protein